jgi:hypothetical protein
MKDASKKGKKDMPDLKKLSRRETAALLGVHYRSISNFLQEEQPIPQNRDGRTFSGPSVVKWYAARCIERAGKPGVESAAAIQWLERYRRERFKLSRLERKEREGRLSPWSEIESEWAGRVRLVSSGLEAFADRLAALLVGKSRDEAHALLRAEVRELRDKYARNGKYTPEVVE